MKNLHAYDSNNNLVHIEEVDKANKDNYTCLNCGNELIARKGKIKAHHFAHKKLINCSFETYLHKLGKLRFHDAYTHCLKSGTPFYLEFPIQRICNACEGIESINWSCNLDDKTEVLDLTKYFDKIDIEKGYAGFVPDILLSSSKIDKVLFVEIAVSHFSSEKKANSGIPIVEIYLQEEGDIEFLKEHKITTLEASFYHFKKKHYKMEYYKPMDCKMPFDIFTVLPNGKAVQEYTKMYDIVAKLKNQEYLHFQIINKHQQRYLQEPRSYYSGLVKEVYHDGTPVRNCNVCRYCTKNAFSYDRIFQFYCKKLQKPFANTHDALECDFFWGIEREIS